MAIQDIILNTPVDIAALRADHAPVERLLDGTFANLLYYAKTHWSYTASGSTGGEALLAGTHNSAPCGGIATALKRVFIDGLGIADTDVEYIRVTGYVWTGPNYLCFDPKVQGNIRKLDGPKEYGNGCIFNEHYYLKCHGKYYDPCLSSVYAVKDQSIKEHFAGTNAPMNLGNRKIIATADKRTCILYLPQEPVPGFQGSWAMFDATKKNIERALGSKDFKTEMAIQQGNSTFAKFVNSLH